MESMRAIDGDHDSRSHRIQAGVRSGGVTIVKKLMPPYMRSDERGSHCGVGLDHSKSTYQVPRWSLNALVDNLERGIRALFVGFGGSR